MELSDAQRAAVEDPSSSLQIIACAGSGKTEVLSRRVIRCLSEGAPPESIIAFTFTEKAAEELKDRIEQRYLDSGSSAGELLPTCRGLFVGTIHGYCYDLLQKCGGRYGCYDPMNEERQWALLLRIARRLGIVDLFANSEGRAIERVATVPAVEAFLKSVDVVDNELISRDRIEKGTPEFATALARYDELLDEMRLLSFGKMISKACAILNNGGPLKETLGKTIRHVFIDEYQDLNAAQEALLRAFHEMGASITAVGDDDQAIYQWRGGDVSLFTGFGERYPGSARRELGENRRSKAPIVEIARSVIETIPVGSRSEKHLRAWRSDASPSAELLVAPTPEDEARLTVKRIRQLLAQGHSPGEVALLFRSVKTSAEPFAKELAKNDIPYHVVGNLPSEMRPETELLTKIFVYWAGGSWYPGGGREMETVTRGHLLELLSEVSKSGRRQSENTLDVIDNIAAQVKERGLFDLVGVTYQLLSAIGIPSGLEAEQQESALGQYTTLLTEFEHAQRRAMPRGFFQEERGRDEEKEDRCVADAQEQLEERKKLTLGSRQAEIVLRRLRSFLEQYGQATSDETVAGSVAEIDRVHVMTIHQAKGLEFPAVFVPCLVERRFPTSLTGAPQFWYLPDDLFDRCRYEGRMDDEKRLFYVALTRAKNLLIMSAFQNYTSRKAPLSRFVKEVASLSCIQQWNTASCAPEGMRTSQPKLEISCSSLLGYGECGFGYWLGEMCGFRPPIAGELGFGRMLHHIMSELTRTAMNGTEPATDDVDRVLSESFYLPFAGPIGREKLRASIERRAKRYLERYGAELTTAVGTEVPFEIPLTDARMNGRIDLVLAPNRNNEDDLVLVDFKTTEDRPPAPIHQNQLRLYAEAVRALGKNPLELYIHNLETDAGRRSLVKSDDRSLNLFRKQLDEWVSGIRSQTYRPTSKKAKCKACDYSLICRERR